MKLAQIQDELFKKCEDWAGDVYKGKIATISFECIYGRAIQEIELHMLDGQVHTIPEDAFTKL